MNVKHSVFDIYEYDKTVQHRVLDSFAKLRFKKLGTDLLSLAIKDQVPSALTRFTSLFGMGRGGTTSLKIPKFLKRNQMNPNN